MTARVNKADLRHRGLHFAWLYIIGISYISIISVASHYFYQMFLFDVTHLQTVWFLLLGSER